MAPATPEHGDHPSEARARKYRSRGVDVEIREAADRVELMLDGHPIKVDLLDGKYSSQTSNMFRTYDSVEEIVEELLANEGRTWTLHGGPDCHCDHDHEDEHEHEHHHDHDHLVDHDHDDGHDHDGGHDHAGGHGGGQP